MRIAMQAAVSAAAFCFFVIQLPQHALAAGDSTEARQVPFAVIQLARDVTVAADFSSTEMITQAFQANNDAGVAQISRLIAPYTKGNQNVEIIDAYTQKADGRKIPVDPSAMFDQPATASNSIISDQWIKIVVFPQLSTGDQVVMRYKLATRNPTLPGQFSYFMSFDHIFEYRDARISLTAPRSLAIRIETHGLQVEQQESGRNITYRWAYTNSTPQKPPTSTINLVDHQPRLFASTLPDYATIGRIYATEAKDKITVTPQIRQMADQITAGITDRKEQTRKIYEWVSGHIRYLAIMFGQGYTVPHDAETVLANGYGDCKDHDVLLQSLLKAKGIAAQSIMLNGDSAYTLSEVPTLTQINHIITYVPEFTLYLDSSASIAPFGTLPLQEYGKPAIRADINTPAQIRIPVLQPGQSETTLITKAKLNTDGTLAVSTRSEAKGPVSIQLRMLGLLMQASGDPKGAVKKMFNNVQVSSVTLPSPTDLTPSYSIASEYSLTGWQDEVRGKSSFYMPPGIRQFGHTGDNAMGDMDEEEANPDEQTVCYSTSQHETLTLELPHGKTLISLPQSVDIATDNLRFISHWSQKGDTVSVQRDFTSRMNEPLCSTDIRRASIAALKQISKSYEVDLQVGKPAKKPSKYVRISAEEFSTQQTRYALFYSHSEQTYGIANPDMVLKSTPDNVEALNDRGVAYIRKKDISHAVADFEHAIALNPGAILPRLNRGRMLVLQGQTQIAINEYDTAVNVEPSNPYIYWERAIAYFVAGQSEKALSDLDEAMRYDDHNAELYVAHGIVCLWLKHYDKALSDSNAALKLSTKYARAYMLRSIVKHRLNDDSGANHDSNTAYALDHNVTATMPVP